MIIFVTLLSYMATWYDHKIEKELNLKIQIKSRRR